jgi:choline-sulfatase
MNVLIIMSDEHSYTGMGCSGHPIVQTPTLDQLASDGVHFSNCYTNSPLCTPARASAYTGKYVHQIGAWDNATPYEGRLTGIGDQLASYGNEMTSFGKLDFHPEVDYQGLVAPSAMHRDRMDTGALFRDVLKARPLVEKRFENIKIREGRHYDDGVRDEAIEWLKTKKREDKPWVLNVGFFHPHFPFHVKKEYWDYYNSLVKTIPDQVKAPFSSLNEPLKALRLHFGADKIDDETIRRMFVGYYALIHELDDNVGQILQVLKEQGLEEDTLVIYTSDHGEQLGYHGLWFKCCMFEQSSHIPMIIRDPRLKQGKQIDQLISLVDLFPTICDALRIPVPNDLQGHSLLDLIHEKEHKRKDYVFSEYHAHGMPTGMYMIRWKQWKYVYYVGYPPQLFDLDNDPEENSDLVALGNWKDDIGHVLQQCEARLRSVCDPEEVDKLAKQSQLAIRESLNLTSYDQADPASSSKGSEYAIPYPKTWL